MTSTKRALGPILAATLATAGVWMLAPASTAEAVCCGATCCMIDGQCRNEGDTNPADSCQVCDPSNSQSQWTTMPDCTSGGSDAGTGGGGGDGSGGGCSVTRGASGPAAAGAGVLLAVGALVLRRRRRA